MAVVSLEKNGITIELHSPVDVAHYKSLGYKQVKSGKKSASAKEDPKADEAPETKLSAQVILAMESLSLEDPEELSSVADKAILKVKGIGRAALRGIRADYPFSEADEAPEGGDEAEAGEGE